jgi:nitrogen fixation negative regulator NifL
MDGRVQSWNPAAERMFGYSAAEAIGQPIIELIVPPKPEVLDQVHHLADDLTQKGLLSQAEHENKRKDGSLILCRWFNTPLLNAAGQKFGAASMALDVTEIQRATQALIRSEQRFRVVADFTYDWEYWTAQDGSINWMSPSCERITGYSVEDFQLDPDLIYRICHSDDRDMVMDHVHEALVEHKIHPIEFRILHRDGHQIWFSHICAPVQNERGNPAGRRVTNWDITDQKRAEEAIRKVSTAVEQSPVSIVITDTQGAIEYVNPMFTTVTGYSSAEAIGQNPRILKAGFTPPEVYKTLWDTLLSGKTWRGELQNKKKNGDHFWEQASISPVKNDQGVITSFVAVKEDISERKHAEHLLQESEQRFRTIFEKAMDGIVIISTDGQILDMNEAYAHMHGYLKEEMLGLHLKDTDTLETSNLATERMRRMLAGEAIKVELGQVHKDGHTYIAEATGSLVSIAGKTAILSFHRDISEQKRAEEEKARLQAQLLQSQKMESLGTLAGGVAHDMNNVLGAILGLASAHIGTQLYGSPLHQALDTICKATERGGKMVKSLLSFARQSPEEIQELDINALLREQVGLLERTTLAKIQLQMDLTPDLRSIEGDSSALNNALMNLCVNAVDAMPEHGTLTLHTRNLDNDWIEVVVEDNGTGMPKEVLEKALEPFFTTKEIGKGTGLGLSMVFSTVKAHQGEMTIQSEPGRGTLVMLRFPAYKSQAQLAAPTASEVTMTSHGTLKVLLVDDDDLIQSSMQALLEVLGHTVITAFTGEEALEKLEAGLQPDVVILDLNMPGLGGARTLPRLRGLRPRVPVLLSTGRADQTALDLISVHPGVTLLSKPFGLRELQKQLENIGLG